MAVAGEVRGARLGSRTFSSAPPIVAAAATALFIGITILWVTLDTRVPDFDHGKHLVNTFYFWDSVRAGNWAAPLTDYRTYPPLVFVVGGAGLAVSGLNTDVPTVVQNLIFVPMLSAGCYLAASRTVDQRAGALAALFALGSPLVITQFHVFLLDAPEAAVVALFVGVVAASDRFRDRRYAVAAGVCFGLGMLTKATFVLYVAGFFAVVIARGGWRHSMNVLLAGVAAALLCLPWYALHLDALRGLTNGAVAAGSAGGGASSPITPVRGSAADLAWYSWNLINQQFFLPLFGFILVGTVAALLRFGRSRQQRDLTPELVAGLLSSYAAVTYLNLHDPRYSLPFLVFCAVLAVGWISRLSAAWRRTISALLALVVTVNVVAVSFSIGGVHRVALRDEPSNLAHHPREVTFVSDEGYLAGGPRRGGDLLGLLRGLKRSGISQVEFDAGSSQNPLFSSEGLNSFVRVVGLARPATYSPFTLGSKDAFVLLHAPAPGVRACAMLDTNLGVFVAQGPPLAPFEHLPLFCPRP